MPAQSGAPDCGLYIRVAADFKIEDIIPKLQQMFSAAKHSAYEKHMHVLELPVPNGTPEGEINVRTLVDFARQNGFVPLIAGDATWASDLDADGVLVEKADDLILARALLGEEGIVGLSCHDRAAAEKGLKSGVDYVTFSGLKIIATLAWWTSKSEIPALADAAVTNNDCADYIRAGATFVNATDFIMTHPKGPVQGTIDMLYAIDLALKRSLH